MSTSDQFLSEMLIGDSVRTPSMKLHVMTKLAIPICYRIQLKKDFGSKIYYPSFIEWRKRIKEECSAMVEVLPLPHLLKPPLIHHIWQIAIRFFCWIRQHKCRLSIAGVMDQFLTSSDWTAEGNINERKVAERLVQYERIPLSKRFELACLHFLNPYISSLWFQIPLKQRKCFSARSKLVMMWSRRLSRRLGIVYMEDDDLFWKRAFQEAVKEGQRTAVVNYWDMLNVNAKQTLILEAAVLAWEIFKSERRNIEINWRGFEHRTTDSTCWCAMPEPYRDIAYFLFSQMSEKQRIQFFLKLFYSSNASDQFLYFLESSYQSYFVRIITKLWDILPPKRYREMWRLLADIYRTIKIEKVQQDPDYEYLLIELLEQTPNNYYRYAFSSFSVVGDLFTVVLQFKACQCRNLKLIQNMLKHSTARDKQSFIYTSYGEKLCKFLINSGYCDILDLILAECLPKERQADYKKMFLLSATGQEICFWIMARENGESMDLLLSWGCFSQAEISFFKHQLIWNVLLSDGRSVNSSSIDRYVTPDIVWDPIEALTTFMGSLNSHDIDRVLKWCLPSQSDRKLYKKHFLSIFNIYNNCKNIRLSNGYFDLKSLIPKLSQFLCWAFSSEEDKKCFKLELVAKTFHSNVLKNVILHEQWQDVVIFVEWFELSPIELKQLKAEVMWNENTKMAILHLLKDSDTQTVSHYLKWGLNDAKTARAFETEVVDYIKFVKSFNGNEFKVLQCRWNQLIKDRLSELTKEQSDEKSDFERDRFLEHNNPRKKSKDNE